jgi:hypothetical protein
VLPPPGPEQATPPEYELELTPPSELLEKHSVPPFWIDRRYDTHHTRALTFPPIFVHRKAGEDNPEKFFHFDLSLTLGWYGKRTSKRRLVSPAVLYFGSFSERKTVWAAVPLLMGYKRVGEQFNFGQFPLVWAWGNKHVKNLFVFPLHYQQKNPEGFRGVSGLIAWYAQRNLDDHDPTNDQKHLVVAPFFSTVTRGLKRVDIAPIYVGGHNLEKGIRHRTLLPFFHWQSREFGNRKEMWTALWISRQDKARNKRAWAVPPLMLFRSKTPEYSIGAITPLMWRSENHFEGRKTMVLGPMGISKAPEQRNNWFFPLWWQFRDERKDTTRSFLLPLLHSRKSPEETRVDTPLFSLRSGKRGQGTGVGIHPLLSYAGRKGDVNYQLIAGGLFWNFGRKAGENEPGRRAWGVGPLLYGGHVGKQRRFGVPPLLTFAGRTETRSYQVVTPLLWHVRNREPGNERNTWVFGPIYGQKRAQGWRAGLPPLFIAGSDEQNKYLALPWLLTGYGKNKAEDRSLLLSPLYVGARSPDSRTIGAGLLFWDVRRKDERHTVLFPALYRRKTGGKTLTITPVGGASRGADGVTWAAGLLYRENRKNRRGVGVLPLFYHENRLSGANRGSTSVFVPLWLRDRRPERDLDVITPLFWRTDVRGEKPYKGTSVVPFYFRMRQPGGVDIDAGFPWFYSRDRTRHTHTLVLGPYFHKLSRERLITGVAPITWWSDSDDLRRLISLPLIFHNQKKSTGEHLTIAVPLWFDRRTAGGRRTWYAFPFVIGVKGRHNFTRFSVTPPIFYDLHRLKQNYRFTGVVPLLFRHQKCGFQEGDDARCRYTLWGSFPLFFMGKDGFGRKTHSFGALYLYDRDKGGKRFFTLLGGGNYRPGERLQWYAGPIYRDTTTKKVTTVVFPIFFRGKHRSEDRSTTVIGGPLFIGQHKEERKWFQSLFMFWHFKSPHKITTVALPPIFGHQHAYAERRLFWIAPLIIRDNQMGRDKRFTSLPPVLFFQHHKGPIDRVVQFPLVWHFGNKTKRKRTTIGGFLWYDVRHEDRKFQILPAIYASKGNALKNTHVVGPGLAWWTKSTDDAPDALDWKAIFGLFGGGHEMGERYMTLFGARIKLRARASRGSKDATEEPTEPESPTAKIEAQELPALIERNERIEAGMF